VKGSTSHMPSRNIVKEFTEDSYYHVYNRGVEKRVIFLDEQDYTVFLGLIKKYLSGENHNTNNRHAFHTLNKEVQLLAYCLMPNHFHLLFYQTSIDGVSKLMRRLVTGYVMYFNNKYARVGGLFQGTYKASRINADAYLLHISRYIHMNPQNYSEWPYSSLRYYVRQEPAPKWLNSAQILDLFDNNIEEYVEFLKSYEESKQELATLKWQLANDPEDAGDM
jgi:putative transposase